MRLVLLAFCACVVLVHATGHGQLGVDKSQEYLLARIASSRPAKADVQLDCSWRRLAYEFAPSLQPLTGARSKELHDALELESMCNEGFVIPSHAQTAPMSAHESPLTVFISPDGQDAAAGTKAEPMLTLKAALAKVKGLREGTSNEQAATIYMRAGLYSLNETLVLTSKDSELVISSYPGKRSCGP